MNWVNCSGIMRFFGAFPEPDDEDLVELGWNNHNKHGTDAGYAKHLRDGEQPCKRCEQRRKT